MTTMQFQAFKPQHDALLVALESSDRHGALFLPAKRATLPTCVGVIREKGPGAITVMGNREPMDIPIGAKVLIRNGSEDHVKLKVAGEDCALIKFGDVLGVIG